MTEEMKQIVEEILNEEWLTVKEVARRLNVHRATVYEIIKNGSLKAVYVGRTIRIPARYLEEYVNSLLAGSQTH
jgi:excisionase family DNA binding protein